LLDHLTELGNDVYPRAGLSCWRIELPGQWEDFVTRLSKSHRKQVRRAARRLVNRGVVLHQATTLDELRQGFEILVDLHQRRWESLDEGGCFARPGFTPFHRNASERLFQAGCVDLVWLELDGRPLAAEYHLLGSDVVYAYQSGIDPDRLEQEPGRLAVTATIQRSIERSFRSYDFLRGDEPYKAHWRAAPRPMWEIRVVPPRASARLRHGVSSATDSVKSWIKSGLELAGLR
jgi:CelD/BcsL family acetyltransferase involved in cellulose biosynthesis